MEVNFSGIKQKDVINLTDGKNLGKTCDLLFLFPEGRLIGITVTGCKGFKFSKQNIFIPLKHVSKIGKDAVLVKYDGEPPKDKYEKQKKRGGEKDENFSGGAPSRRSFDEYE